MSNILVGRQPICDENLSVRAYELLYRPAPDAVAAGENGDRASATVALNSVLEIGLDRIVGNRRAFLNMTRSFLVDGHYQTLPPDRVVLEILEDVTPDPELLRAVAEARDRGYTIALDDFVYREELQPLVDLADLIKVEVPALEPSEVIQHARQLRRPDLTLVAEKVESHEVFDLCRQAGYDLFQGFFFCRPRIIERKGIPTERLALLQLLARIQDPFAEMDEIEELVKRNVSLSYRLIQLANSALYSTRNPIESIRQAITMLGLKKVRACVSLLLLAGIDDKPHELFVTALVRARMCQLLAGNVRDRPEELFFLVGLLSVLDALMDQPLEDLLRNLPLSVTAREALLEGKGAAGAALQIVRACEQGDWSELDGEAIPVDTVQRHYLEALEWAASVEQEMVAA